MTVKTWFLDFESYYDQQYSLRKLTPVEYILDPRWETIGCAVKEGVHGTAFWVDGPDFGKWISGIDPETSVAVSHNTLFDGCVLAWRYGWYPRLYVDTLGVSRALLAHQLRSLSLDSVSKHLGLPPKGNTVTKVMGMRRDNIIAAGLYDEYVSYSKGDVENCALIYDKLVRSGQFPASEILVQDAVLRCAIQPKFRLDQNLLCEHLNTIQVRKQELFLRSSANDKTDLMSNDRFAKLLQDLGVDPPRKISLRTGEETWAFAKTDPGMIALEEHEDPNVQTLVAARLGHKSTLEETRTQRLINISLLEWPAWVTPGSNEPPKALMPVPLRFSGAHTHRLSGDWKLNMQNLPTRKGNTIRRALVAPFGHKVVVADASQIEARIVAWICGQPDLVELFATGADVYSAFASEVFGFPVNKKEHPGERFVGKTCIAEGTMVVTARGNIPIEKVRSDDLLWDGEEWVCHQGLVSNGSKETLPLCGIWLTPDHLVLCGTQWREAESVSGDRSILCQALGTGAENWLSRVTCEVTMASPPSLSAAIAEDPNTQSPRTISGTLSQPGATPAQKTRPRRSGTGPTPRLYRTTPTAPGSLTGWRQRLHAATLKLAACSSIMVAAASRFIRSGERTAPVSFAMSNHSPAGTGRTTRWIASTPIKGTNPTTFGSSVGARTSGTSARSPTLRRRLPVYDIACSGPRNRFAVMTAAGPLIVHNCILGLGYQTGWKKLQGTIKAGSREQLGYTIDLTDPEAQRYVNTYRRKYSAIPAAWKELHNTGISVLANGGTFRFGPCVFEKGAVLLPNGLRLHYPNVRSEDGHWCYDYAGEQTKLYGGALLENIVQALARIITMDAAVRIQKRLRTLSLRLNLQAHDELAYVVPDKNVTEVKAILLEEMARRPTWGTNLPLASEAGEGQTYGGAK